MSGCTASASYSDDHRERQNPSLQNYLSGYRDRPSGNSHGLPNASVILPAHHGPQSRLQPAHVSLTSPQMTKVFVSLQPTRQVSIDELLNLQDIFRVRIDQLPTHLR